MLSQAQSLNKRPGPGCEDRSEANENYVARQLDELVPSEFWMTLALKPLQRVFAVDVIGSNFVAILGERELENSSSVITS